MITKIALGLITALTIALPSAAFAEGAVKVECWGSCSVVTLGQICDTYASGSQPVAISCDDTDVGAGWNWSCGGLGGWATCRPFGSIVRSDRLSDYCSDGGGFDAVVTCKAPGTLTNESSIPKKDDGAGKLENQ
jgi:hypothetical protein